MINVSRAVIVLGIFPLDGRTGCTFSCSLGHDGGRVDFFVPDNLIIGTGVEIKRPSGDFYKVDFEVGTIVLEIPDGLYGSERTSNILDDFIASYTDGDGLLTGLTRMGFPAMKFADCSYVTSDALKNEQIRFSVAVQSFSPNVNGLSEEDYEGAIVDGNGCIDRLFYWLTYSKLQQFVSG